MIDSNGNYTCDYCHNEIGEFYDETGNHVVCQDDAAEYAKLANDYVAVIKANAEVASLNADMIEQLAALRQAVEAVGEDNIRAALIDKWSKDYSLLSGVPYRRMATEAAEIVAALAKLDGVK